MTSISASDLSHAHTNYTTTMSFAQQQDNTKGKYELLGKGVDEVCSRFEPNSVLGPVSKILACRVRQYQDPQVDPSNWRNALEICKYDIYDNTQAYKVPQSSINYPKQIMAFGIGSCKIVLQTINNYIKLLMSHLGRCPIIQPTAHKSNSKAWMSMGLAIEKYLRDTTGLVVGQCIPTLHKEIQIMKDCALPTITKPGGTTNISRDNIFWTIISQFPNPQTKKQTCKDEMYGVLVRTPQWGKPNTDKLQWFGVKVVMQRQDTALKELFKDNSMLVLHSQETLALLKYLTQPFTNPGSTTLLSTVWPELLNDVVVEKLMKKGTDLDTVHQEQHLHEDNTELCTYLGDGGADSTSSPCLLEMINYTELYDDIDSTDATADESPIAAITPPATLAIKSVSAPKKQSGNKRSFTTPRNKVKFTTPTGEQIVMDEDDDEDVEDDDDMLFITQKSPTTPKSSKRRKRSAATDANQPAQKKGRRLTTTTPTDATYTLNPDDDINDDFNDVLNDDDNNFDKIIA